MMTTAVEIQLPACLRLRFDASFLFINDPVLRQHTQRELLDRVRGKREAYTMREQVIFPLYSFDESVTPCGEAILYDLDSAGEWLDHGDFSSFPIVLVKREQVAQNTWGYSFSRDGQFLGRLME